MRVGVTRRVVLLAALVAMSVSSGAMTDAALVARMQPRVMTARRVAAFDEAQVLATLRAVQADFAETNQFVMCEHAIRPTTEICWDVCRDAQDVLHVSLYFHDVAKGPGAGDRNSIEFAFNPNGETGPGHLQCGVTGTGAWSCGYWPYRDGRPNLLRRFASEKSLTFHVENVGEGRERLVTLHVPVAAVCAPASKGLIGFNMMRCNLSANENATWNPTCGAAFPDASGFGWLRLSDEAPMPKPLPAAKPLAGKPQLQVQYDWPDEMCGGPYTREALKAEFAFLKRHNVGRIYWIYYPDFDAPYKGPAAPSIFTGNAKVQENERKTFESCGEDVTFAACRIAHELGLEFYVTVKPYDLSGYNAFLKANGAKYGFRRNPKWTDPQGPKQVKKLTLYRAGDKPFEFDVNAVKVLTSMDNVAYAPATGFKVAAKAVDLPNAEWTPAGNRPTGGTHKAWALEFTDIPGKAEYVAFEFPKGAWSFRAPRYELVAVETDMGRVRGMCSALKTQEFGLILAKPSQRVFEFIHDGASAGWADATEAIDNDYGFSAGGSFAVKLSEIATRGDMLDPTFPEVRAYWCEYFVKPAIAAGVDGLDVRIANHHVASDWLAYCYAEPVLAAFRTQYGREPECTPADYEAVRRIRGAAHTQFLREAGALLHKAGKKLEHHVEARMKSAPAFDAYQGIHYDWATWIDEGIVDGVNLKYLGPFNRFVATEIMPRAQKRGIPVHQITAYDDPRTLARTAEADAAGIEACRLGGVAGFDLYETWIYLRTLPTGERMIRGNALKVFEDLKPLAKDVK